MYKTWQEVRTAREATMPTWQEKLALRKKIWEDEKAYEEEAKKLREAYLDWYMKRISQQYLIDKSIKSFLAARINSICVWTKGR